MSALDEIARERMQAAMPECIACAAPLRLVAGPLLACTGCGLVSIPDPEWLAEVRDRAYAEAERLAVEQSIEARSNL